MNACKLKEYEMTSKVMTHVVVVKIPHGTTDEINSVTELVREIVSCLSGDIKHSVKFKNKKTKSYDEVYVPANFSNGGIPQELDYLLDGFEYTVCIANPLIGLVQDHDGRILCSVTAKLPLFKRRRGLFNHPLKQTGSINFQVEGMAS